MIVSSLLIHALVHLTRNRASGEGEARAEGGGVGADQRPHCQGTPPNRNDRGGSAPAHGGRTTGPKEAARGLVVEAFNRAKKIYAAREELGGGGDGG